MSEEKKILSDDELENIAGGMLDIGDLFDSSAVCPHCSAPLNGLSFSEHLANCPNKPQNA